MSIILGDKVVCMFFEVTVKTNDQTDNVKSICSDNFFQEIDFLTWISVSSIAKIIRKL